MKVSENFTRGEFACKCGCGFNAVDIELLYVLQDLRDWANAGVAINSGNRCPPYNAKVGGAAQSMHTKGMAADIAVAKKSPKEVGDYLAKKYSGKYGVKVYPTWTHIDVRPTQWRG